MSMIERVARALAANNGVIWGGPRGEDDPDFTLVRLMYLSQARAAIEAMRDEDEITDEMLEAGRVALHAPENRHGAVLGAVFCAMLDAALTQGESE